MPEISVVIPAYNSGATIRDALNSLSEQTFRDFETIVVDDGSTDGTADLIGREFPEAQVIRQDNAGPASARNAGVNLAKGKWIAFLDADDAWLPRRLDVQIDLAGDCPDVAMWCGQTLKLEGQSDKQGAGFKELETVGIDDHPDPGWQLDHISTPGAAVTPLPVLAFAYLNPVATSTVLIRRTVFDQCGGFDPQFRGPEDYDLWMRVAAIAKVAKIAAPLARYREDPGSLSMDDRRFLPEVLRLLDKAYGPTGVLKDVGHIRKARAVQYVHASWMAYRRGVRGAAVAHLLRSLMTWPMPLPKARWKYLGRYFLN